jgi:hypothetical protein
MDCSRDYILHAVADVTTVDARKSIAFVFKMASFAVRVASVRIVRINLVITTISVV